MSKLINLEGNLFDIDNAISFIREALLLVSLKENEHVIRDNITSSLSKIFPDDPEPWWVRYHSRGAESHVSFYKNEKESYGFVDTLVGLTAIEYEKDLSKKAIYNKGIGQVKDYCAGLLNQGHEEDLIIGVLSDSVRWYAYKITIIDPEKAINNGYGREHIDLHVIDSLVLNNADAKNARSLGSFLVKHVGRKGARQLTAHTLSLDLGFNSTFCNKHLSRVESLISRAFDSNPKYANLIMGLWKDFIDYIGATDTAEGFNKKIYIGELYLLTLAKLLCANIINRIALDSTEKEIVSILNGEYFKARSLSNIVEFDYFGWINSSPYINDLIPVAQRIQDDLRAYNFDSTFQEDLFGKIFAQLADRYQRLLLGQEWTPEWLAKRMVDKVFEMLPDNSDPRLVDMCCGSGAIVVETIKKTMSRLDEMGVEEGASYIRRLSSSITGFDVDPLAVMLSKVGWVIACRDKLEPFGAYGDIVIPIYHADSLFVATPLSKSNKDNLDNRYYKLILDDQEILLPTFLVTPKMQRLYDTLISYAYDLAIELTPEDQCSYGKKDLMYFINIKLQHLDIELSKGLKEDTLKFLSKLIKTIDILNKDGRNGIWSFILKNSYRPGLVAGSFNGLISNPPWLALSKIANNPYSIALKEKAKHYQITPKGPSHLHIELSTIFLLHAVDHYLSVDGVIACILPDTILNGDHHTPFRKGEFSKGKDSLPLFINELWRIDKCTFKNEAIVTIATKKYSLDSYKSSIPGKIVTPTETMPTTFNVLTQGNKTVWSNSSSTIVYNSGNFKPANFYQGADIMPRTLVFHEIQENGSGFYEVNRIDRNTSENRYLVRGAKKYKDFSLSKYTVPEYFLFDVLISNHLTPFDIASPAKAFLPIQRNEEGGWKATTMTKIATHVSCRIAFNEVFSSISSQVGVEEFYQKLDSKRKKLTNQIIPITGWIILLGAGGGLVCSAYIKATELDKDIIIDQTLYWASVASEDEAIYLVGLFNSKAVNTVIKEFQARGAQGERHIHTLPISVTPQYDPSNNLHKLVVTCTKKLLFEWNNKKVSDAKIEKILDLNKSLAPRRKKIRVMMQQLKAYPEYELACNSLYGI